MAHNVAWPPDYGADFERRAQNWHALNGNAQAIGYAKHCYATGLDEDGNEEPWRGCVRFINDWCVTYNPRNNGLKTIPFLLFQRQEDFVKFLLECFEDKESGLVEKARDIGATWICCAFSVWLWLFMPGSSIGWGSRKEALVDKLGDPDSIFQKMRMIVDTLPDFMLPIGFNPKTHMTYMRFVNPENGAIITGESGDNIGRGGRSSIYFKDESAHYERPELIEAALGDNTDVQIDISSVNGTNNVYYRRRQAGEEWTPTKKMTPGKTRVFVFEWSDHPGKDQAWYDKRRAKAASEGLLHIFAQEVDRDYASSLDRIIIPAKYINAAVDAHIKLKWKKGGLKVAMQDVADEGGDKNAFAYRQGSVLKECQDWGEGDTGETARRAVNMCKEFGIGELYYDCIGVGAGVKSETNRLRKIGALPPSMMVMPWDASANPLNPTENMIPGDIYTPKNEDYFASLKSQAWMMLSIRFEKTYKTIVEGATEYTQDEMISLPSGLENLHQIKAELGQAQMKTSLTTGKMVVDKKPDGGRSPNMADAIVGCYWPTRQLSILDVL